MVCACVFVCLFFGDFFGVVVCLVFVYVFVFVCLCFVYVLRRHQKQTRAHPHARMCFILVTTYAVIVLRQGNCRGRHYGLL